MEFWSKNTYITLKLRHYYIKNHKIWCYICGLSGLVAQLDRVSVSGAEGYGFDSLRGHTFFT